MVTTSSIHGSSSPLTVMKSNDGHSSVVRARVTPMRRPVQQKYPSLGIDISTWRTLDIHQVDHIISLCAEQIKVRGLDIPLILSPLALDISRKNVEHLLATYHRSRSSFANDVRLAEISDVATAMKRALSRMRLGVVGLEDAARARTGIVRPEVYTAWASEERAARNPSDFLSFCLYPNLAPEESQLLDRLFSLLESVAAHATNNGMTVGRLARHFAGWIIDVPELDQDSFGFDQTYVAWLNAAMATEHLILAFIRQHAHRSPTGLPPSLASVIKDYPLSVLSDVNEFASQQRHVRMQRLSRTVRVQTKDVISSALQWRLADWQEVKQNGFDDDTLRCLAQISDQDFEVSSLVSTSPSSDTGDFHAIAPHVTAFRTLSDRQWRDFEQAGFAEGLEDLPAFNMKESSRKAAKSKRDTVDWGAFSTKGFDERSSLVLSPSDLNFDRLHLSPVDPRKLKEERKRVQKEDRRLPKNLNWDPQYEELDYYIDEIFASSVWLDRVVCARPNGIRDCEWAIVHFKGSSKIPSNSIALEQDSGTWILIEETVPNELRSKNGMAPGTSGRSVSLGSTLLGRKGKREKMLRNASSPIVPTFVVPPKIPETPPDRMEDQAKTSVDLSTLDQLTVPTPRPEKSDLQEAISEVSENPATEVFEFPRPNERNNGHEQGHEQAQNRRHASGQTAIINDPVEQPRRKKSGFLWRLKSLRTRKRRAQSMG